MKKITAMIIVLTLCICVVSCNKNKAADTIVSSSESIESYIQGTWVYETEVNGGEWREEFYFADREVIYTAYFRDDKPTINTAVYSINGDKLYIYFENTEHTSVIDIIKEDSGYVLKQEVESGSLKTRIFIKQ